jgi:hypothetical protein
MAANHYRRFTSICPAIQRLVARLIQEEFTPLLALSGDLPESAWVRAVTLADPTFLYCTAGDPAIRICPDSYQPLRECLLRELTQA